MDLATIVEACDEKSEHLLPVWWSWLFYVFAEECFRGMGIQVAFTDIHEPPRWQDIKDSKIKMSKKEFKDYVLNSALNNNDTSFLWHVNSILPKEGGKPWERRIEMGAFDWEDDLKDSDLEQLAYSEE